LPLYEAEAFAHARAVLFPKVISATWAQAAIGDSAKSLAVIRVFKRHWFDKHIG
jgi:hypothetical protein